MSVAVAPSSILDKLGLKPLNPGACTGPNGWFEEPGAAKLTSFNPTTGEALAAVSLASADGYDRVAAAAHAAFLSWRETPAPRRGELVRDLGQALRDLKEPLGDLVSLEMGKIRAEGHGEVQEMIDICDFATGLSRQLYGLTIASERPGHRMMEQWHPLGPIGVITAFNFPVAVWSWNAAIAAVCGDTVVWKPAEPTPLCAIAVQHIANRVMADHGVTGVFTLAVGPGRTVGEAMLDDRAAAARVVHGIDGDRPARVVDGRPPLRPHHPRARRQQRHRRHRRRQSRSRGARDPLRRGRHGGAALHLDAAHHRAHVGDARARRSAAAAPTRRCGSATRSTPAR